LSIKSDEADRLARELAAETGESLTEAVVIALRERLELAVYLENALTRLMPTTTSPRRDVTAVGSRRAPHS